MGGGLKKIEMNFLPDVYVKCEQCNGRRFNNETLSVKLKGNSISDVLSMTINEASILFENYPRINRKLKTLIDVGLGYITLGQSVTISGGEAQRIKLATELSQRDTGKTLLFSMNQQQDFILKILKLCKKLFINLQRFYNERYNRMFWK